MTSEKGNDSAPVVPTDSPVNTLANDPKLDNVSQKRIGDQLRAMYDDLVQQPVPDRFRDLLAELEGRALKLKK